MCNLVALSTTCPDDLRRIEQACCLLEPLDEDDPLYSLLEHPHRWFVSSQYGGCSCHFRHWSGWYTKPWETGPDGAPVHHRETEPNFGPPQDWFPEEDDDVQATAEFWDILQGLVAAGQAVEVLCVWERPPGTGYELRTHDVSLREVPREAFRFNDGWRFRIRP